MDIFFKKNQNKITLSFKGKIVQDNLQKEPTKTDAKNIDGLDDGILYVTDNSELIAEIETILSEEK